MGGTTLLQPWPNAFGMRKYFSKDYVVPSPKLNEHQKKGLRRKLKCVFLAKLGEDRRIARNSQWGGGGYGGGPEALGSGGGASSARKVCFFSQI